MRIRCVFAAILLCSSAASAKFYEATHYDVKLSLDPQGVLNVTETADFRFVAGPFTFVFRDLATTETDGIDNVEASLDGRPCSIGTGPGQVEIEGKSPVKVRWHFQEIMSGNHTFTVRYRVLGALRPHGSGQMLSWRLLPNTKGYHIFSSEVVLEYPTSVSPQSIVLRSHAPDFQIGAGRATAILVNPETGSAVVDAKFPAGSFSAGTPKWIGEKAEREADAERNLQLAEGGSALFLLIACIGLFRLRMGSNPTPHVQPVDVTWPPDTLPPALAGFLASRGGLSIGVLLDLARRGVVRVEETAKGFLGSRHFQVVWLQPNAMLSAHEQVLHDLVFPQGETSVKLQEFLSRQAAKGRFTAAVRDEAKALGLMDESRARLRTLLFRICVVLAIVGGAMMFVPSLPVRIFAGSALAVSLLALILGSTQTMWSDAGVVASHNWKAYARYLSKAESVPHLEQVLPYAAAFGVAAPLLKKHNMPMPVWFQAFDGSDSASFETFMAYGDSSSSSDSGGGSGDGGGASGGGTSGAG